VLVDNNRAERQLSSDGHFIPVGAVRTSFTQAADLQLSGSHGVVSSIARDLSIIHAESALVEHQSEVTVTTVDEQLEEIEFSLRSVWTETAPTERRTTRKVRVEWSNDELMPSTVTDTVESGRAAEVGLLPQADAVEAFRGNEVVFCFDYM
jgi:YbbR domain-containing protein